MEADRLLATFADRNAGTEEAAEVSYWRGLFQLDPDNRESSPQSAVALFDVYLKSGETLHHRLEAEVFRRIGTRLVALGSTSNATPASSSPSSAGSGDHAAEVKAKDTEIQRLKDELAKANDELERIKRRLTAPTKP